MNLNNVFGYIAKSGAKVGIIICNSNSWQGNEEDDNSYKIFIDEKENYLIKDDKRISK